MNLFDLRLGDCLEILDDMDENSFDSAITDPPYHLASVVKRFGKKGSAPCQYGTDGAYQRASTGFMGKSWDGGDISFQPETWAAVMRVLKPGAHLVAFAAPKNYHRMACAIEDAGFEIRDQIQWLYGSGFPKSHNQKGDWEGWGTGLKPAHEPICVARKPFKGSLKKNLEEWGVGAYNIDACRVPADGRPLRVTDAKDTDNNNTYSGRKDGSLKGGSKAAGKTDQGRWPANVIHDGSDEVLEAFPDSKGQRGRVTGKEPSRLTDNCYGEFKGRPACEPRDDSGSAARFFYCSKASKADRDEGLEDLPLLDFSASNAAQSQGEEYDKAQSIGMNRTKKRKNNHPTVKPTDLMRYLCALVTPPGGRVLDPFMGSGSTGKAALLAGFRFTGIELEEPYLEIARKRIQAVAPDEVGPELPSDLLDLLGGSTECRDEIEELIG